VFALAGEPAILFLWVRMVRLQPTPTDRIDNKNLSTLDKMIFCYLW